MEVNAITKIKVKKVTCGIIVSVLIISVILCVGLTVPLSAKQIFYKSLKSIVELKASAESVGDNYGTAVFIDKDGTLVTNAHIVTYKHQGSIKTFETYFIRFASEEDYRNVELLKYDIKKDIALLKFKDNTAQCKPLKLGDSDKVFFGERVYAIGNGSNLGLSITQGIIGIPKVNIEYDNITREAIQCDLTISEGNSGGALLDKKGRLIGITTFQIKDSSGDIIYGLAYCIPINSVIDFLNG